MNEANKNGLKYSFVNNQAADSNLEAYVSGIKHVLYEGNYCTFWMKEPSLLRMYNNLSKLKVLYQGKKKDFGWMLTQILELSARTNGIRNIIVDSETQKSENWIYVNHGVWIMTTNYFFTTLYVAFKERNFPTEALELFAKEEGFSFDIQTSDSNQDREMTRVN